MLIIAHYSNGTQPIMQEEDETNDSKSPTKRNNQRKKMIKRADRKPNV